MAINSDPSSDCDSQCNSRPDEVLCDYEKKRLENVKKNQEMMKTLGLPVCELGNTGRPITRGKARTSGTTQGAGGSRGRKRKKKRKHWSASESDSDWEPWMEVQTSNIGHKTKLPTEFLEMQEAVDREVEEVVERGCVVGNKKRHRTSTRGGGKRSTCQGTSSLLEVTLPEMFNSDLSDKEEFKAVSVEDLEKPNGCTHGLVGNEGGDDSRNGDGLFPEETLDDETEFTRFTEQDVQTGEVHNYSTRRSLWLATIGNKKYEEDVLSDEDEYLFCDDGSELYHGERPVHCPLSELNPTAGDDQASLVHTQLPVPAQLTVRPSVIPGAGLGVFAVSRINKGVRVGPYEGRKVVREDMGDLYNTAYAWEIRHEGVDPYVIDGQDPSHSNWMRFVNCARNEDEQNVLAYQYCGGIYYCTFKTIYPESELLVWYGEKYAKELGIDLDIEASTANFCCRGCGGSFSEETSFRIHLKHSSKCTVANPQVFTCLKCHQHFTQIEYLQQHIKTHENLSKHKQCSYCGRSFSWNCLLQVHLRTHTGDKPFKCQHCGKSFSRNYCLQVHLRTHTGDKPFKCQHCGKSFTDNGSLVSHIRTHTGDKPFKCEHCEKSFSQNYSLQVHLRTHTGDKPFKCEHCGKRFSQNCGLNVHLRTHTGDRPFKCEHCGKSFSVNGNLQVHLRTHT